MPTLKLGSTTAMTESGGTVTLDSATVISGVTFPVGHIIQVVQKTDTDNATQAAGGTYTNALFDNLNMSITPHKSSSKILISACVSISHKDSDTGHVRLVRDPTGTPVALAIGPADGSTTSATFSMRSSSEHCIHHQAITYLDSPTIPSTPVAIWYGFQGYVNGGSGALGYNMSENTSTTDANMGRHMSTLTLMEIAQ